MKYTWKKTGIGTVDNLGRQFEKVMRNCNRASIGTRWRYAKANQRFIRWLGPEFNLQKLLNLQDKHLEAYGAHLKNRDCSDKYVKNELSAIRFLHNQITGARHELADSLLQNKKIGLESTPDGRAQRSWTNTEVRKMWKLAQRTGNPEYAKLIEIMRSIGCRINEAATLRRGDIESALRNGYLHIKGKGGRERDVPLSPRAYRVLEHAIEGVPRGEYVLIPEGMKVHSFKLAAQKWIIKNRDRLQDPDRARTARNVLAGEKGAITSHGLRHAFAKEIFQKFKDQGMDVKDAFQQTVEILGHSRPEILRTYLVGND